MKCDLQHVGKQRAEQRAQKTVVVFLRTGEHQLLHKEPYHWLREYTMTTYRNRVVHCAWRITKSLRHCYIIIFKHD